MGDNDDYYDGDGTMDSLGATPEVIYNWVDITDDFFKHIQDLKIGELLHDGHLFGLFEAMSAIEMMDPKMDAGMLCNRGNPKPLNFQQAVEVLITLSFYATGSYQRPTGDIAAHSVAQQTISAVIKQVTHSLNLLHFRQKYIKFPNSANERRATIVGFYNKFNMPGVLGCIDGTHIAIKRPEEHEERFYCRKQYHSLNVQLVLITLSFYATGSYQRPTGDIAAHSVAQQTISAVIKQVTHSLNLLHFRQKYIKFPNSANERRATIVGFYNKFNMPGVLGCIDGTHIAIKRPEEHEERFYCRKQYHSLNVQLAGKLKIDDLEPAELIGIIDATMACIVSWLEGHSLAQTVFTNIYLHQPHSILNKTLKAYCIAVYKLLDCIRDCINKAQVFEEEDFQPMGYGYRLGSNPQAGNTYDASLEVSEQKCIAMLREQEEELNKKARSTEEEDNLWTALAARIRFTRMFYQALLLITKKDSQSGADCVALLNGCSEMMKVIIRTSGKGTQPVENSDSPNPMGFEPMINQRLLPPTFPRYTRIKPRPEALQYFDEQVARLRHAWKITSCTNFHTALDFFMEFSRQRACILSRSALQLLYLSPSPATTASMAQSAMNVPPGQPRPPHAFVEILRESVKNFVNPPALTPKSPMISTPQAREFVENFLARCVRPFAVLLQVCGHNRARQRDKLALLLDEFAALQEEAESVDAVVSGAAGTGPRACFGTGPRACFGTWVLYHVLRIMIAYLLSGLELELYSVHEYHYIFWYLYEFLYGWLVSAVGRAESLANDSSRRDTRDARKRKTKKRVRPYAREGLLCQVMQNMCGGYYKALVAFKLQGKIRQPAADFDNEAVRYKHRFAPLAVITPPQVHYHEFCEMTQPLQYENPVILYLGGCKHFQQARSLLETITTPDQEVQDLLKVAKTNFIVLKLLAGGHKRDSTTPPEFDFSVHRHFPIIKLV